MIKRIITGFFLTIIIVPLILVGGIPYKILIMMLSCLALWEYIRTLKKYPFIVNLIMYLYMILLVLSNINDIKFHIDETIILSLFISFIIPSFLYHKSGKYKMSDAFHLIGSVLFLGTAFSLFINIRNMSLNILIYLFIITVSTDTFAYLIGKKFGKHKLIPSISPNKTWEGSFGGTLFAIIFGSIFYLVTNKNGNIYIVLLMTLFLSIMGQIGDLIFSAIKRERKIKDFSNILPGHGGILDRFDSMIIVLMVYKLFITL